MANGQQSGLERFAQGLGKASISFLTQTPQIELDRQAAEIALIESQDEGARQEIEDAKVGAQEELQMQNLSRVAFGDGPGADAALAEIFARDPVKGKRLFEGAGAISDDQRQEMVRDAQALLALPFDQRNPAILERAARLEGQVDQQGRRRDASQTLSLRDMDEETQTNQLRAIVAAGLTPAEFSQQFGVGGGTERKTAKGADGRLHFIDDGSLVFPDIQAAPSEAGDVRSRKIGDLMRLQGLSEAKAVNLVDGHTRTEISDKTGAVVTLDTVAGTATEVPFSAETQDVPTPGPGETLFDLAEVATGPVASLTAKGAAALSFFNINPEQASTSAQQVFRTETQNLIRALSINPRFPVGEMNRIREEISIQPSFFQGKGTLRQKMEGLDVSLRRRLEQADRDAGDPNLDIQTRQMQGANASAIRNFLPILGVPENQLPEDQLNARIQELEIKLGIDNE